MKKYLLGALALAVVVPVLMVVTAFAAPPLPAECTAVYANTIEVNGNAKYVNASNGNNYIVVNGDRNYIKGNGGDDCIVVNGEANLVNAGNGADDVLASTGTRNSLRGDNGPDYIVGNVNDSLKGGAGIDTCVADPSTNSVKQCEL